MAQVKVYVTLKPSLLDAQGKVVQGALQQLGYENVEAVRIGKYIEMSRAETAQDARGAGQRDVRQTAREPRDRRLSV